ncbi:MAG: T9SS type A sorting domain-containing protein [Balneola sp.]
MKKLIQFFAVLSFVAVPILVQAQDTVSVKQLNTYDGLTEYSQNALQAHPLNGVTVTYTGVIVSNPKTSGNATPSDSDSDGTIDDIGRIHVFITDTAAVTQGRDGMSIQIVESDYELLEGFQRGDVVTFVGRMTFFNSTVQMTADEASLQGTTSINFPQYAELLNPWEVSVDELVTANADGTFQLDIDSYQKYNNAYVKVTGATVSNIALGDRVDWAINENGSRMYMYDISLRYRNDRGLGYLPGWNYRRLPGLEGGSDGNFTPPPAGAVVNVNGFINLQGDDPDGTVAANQISWSMSPFEDGILWTTDDNTGDPLRCVDGELCNGETLVWPSDVEVVGLPATFSNAAQSDSTVTSSDAVTASVDIVAGGSATISSAVLIYSAGSVSDTLAMTNSSGNTYEATLPTFDNFTPVSFYFEATDSEGLTGRDPISGNYSFFVQDEAINSIAIIQTTADAKAGPSPLDGAGQLPVNISGIIVSDNSDGVIILQEAAEAWSGVFLERTTATQALVKGDSITVTSAQVSEAAVANNSLTLTQLVNLEFTTNSSGNDMDQVIPVITTDTVQALQNGGELEQYEGMVVKFEGVELTDRGAFGEYTLQNTDADSANGVQFNEDIRSTVVGNTQARGDYNKTVRAGKTLDAYAVVAASFGAPKFHPRTTADIIAADGNAFTPVLDFSLTGPADSSEIVADEDFTFTWNASLDFDDDDVTYQWRLLTEDTTEVLLSFMSDNEGVATSIVSPAEDVNMFLEELGIDVGQSGSFVWHVRVTDGSDTLGVRGPYGNFGDDWEPIYRHITIERSIVTSNDEEFGTPEDFALEQNYPNPFNPSTNIKFSLPQTSDVTLTIYNMLGQKVNTLVSTKLNAGIHTYSFDASNLSSGMYIYRIEAGSFSSIKKMLLIK